jgi:hypothetical protein
MTILAVNRGSDQLTNLFFNQLSGIIESKLGPLKMKHEIANENIK